jgi:hypothetical protein
MLLLVVMLSLYPVMNYRQGDFNHLLALKAITQILSNSFLAK